MTFGQGGRGLLLNVRLTIVVQKSPSQILLNFIDFLGTISLAIKQILFISIAGKCCQHILIA